MLSRNLSVSVFALALLAACGGASNNTYDTGGKAAKDCPPLQKGNGIMVSSRYNYDDLLKANQWRTEMFPRACAGNYADLIPDLPAGFGVVPTHKPYIMTDNHVHLAYGELPDELFAEEGIANVPLDLNRIDFEIVKFTDDEIAKVRAWMDDNPKSFQTNEVNGETVFLIGGFGTGRPGKGDRLATSLHAFLDDGTVVRVIHPSIFSQTGDPDFSPLVISIMGDILERADRAGL